MKRLLLFAGAGLLLGGLAVGSVAEISFYPLTIFGRRLSPAWMRVDDQTVGASDLKKLYARIDDLEEFHTMVLMNEVHGHIGPWSILGCKMAMRAMDLLGAGTVDMTVISEGGDEPPGGSVTDGISIGSGSTVGAGLLKLSGGPPKPAAIFVYEDRAVRLEAKPLYSATIRDTMQAIEDETGGPSQSKYWMRLRVFGIKVWEEWDRGELFDEAWVDPADVSAVEEALVTQPQEFSLSQNAPNPFNAGTSVSFTIPREAQVELTVYNAAGQPVRSLLQGRVAGGPTSLTWDGRDDQGREVAGGVYFYHLATDDGRATAARKMCLVK